MLIVPDFQTVAFFDMPHLPRFFHLPPIVYCWLFSLPTGSFKPFKHSLTIMKESKGRGGFAPLHQKQYSRIFYFADALYLFNECSEVETQFSSNFYDYRQLHNEQP